ncbi:MAG: hypothetical protein GY945_00045 [Rhodobacteraceae bacterium]|nr:hypothetical protein [Paracoccaceae bacterium]
MTKTDKRKAAGLILGLTALVGLSWYIWGVGLWSWAARDFENQYNLARSSGKLAEMCTRSGLVAESHLQAENQVQYQIWDEIEKRDCAAANIIE